MAVPLSSSALHTLLVSLVERRHKQISYIKQVYTGQTLYMNTVRISFAMFDPSSNQCVLDPSTYATRCHIYTLLGLSLARIMEVNDIFAYVDDLTALSHELADYQKYFMNEQSNNQSNNPSDQENNQTNLNKSPFAVHIARHAPSLKQSNNHASNQSNNQSNNQSINIPKNLHLFTQLYVPASLSLDTSKSQSLFILFLTLMDLLPSIYSKFLNNQSTWTIELTQRILSIDRKLRDELIIPMMNDAQLAAQRVEKDELQQFHNVTTRPNSREATV